jgi:hypothetical protein
MRIGVEVVDSLNELYILFRGFVGVRLCFSLDLRLGLVVHLELESMVVFYLYLQSSMTSGVGTLSMMIILIREKRIHHRSSRTTPSRPNK